VVAALAVGGIAYVQLTGPGPTAPVPAVTDRDVFAALAALRQAGFGAKLAERSSARPGGLIISQRPAAGHRLEQGEVVSLVVSSTSATVPDVLNEDIDTARGDLARRGLVNLQLTDDFRTDVTPGIVTRTSPDVFARTAKRDVLTVFVARDPHVTVPDLQGKDQAAAIDQLHGQGLEVAVATATSRTVASGMVIKNNHVGDVLLRGDTVTITVSTGPRQVKVKVVLGQSRDDAIATLEDAGFAVAVATTPVTSSAQDGVVLAESPSGGTAPEGSTVTISVGAKTRKGG
jgi:serine/threonine-protein kinase